MGVSAAEEAGPDETEEARPDETRRRAEAPRVTPREKSVVDASAPVATVPPMYCVRPDGPPRSKLSDHLQEAAGRVHLGRLARAVLELQPSVHSPGAARRLAAATSSSFAFFESPDKAEAAAAVRAEQASTAIQVARRGCLGRRLAAAGQSAVATARGDAATSRS